MEHDTEEVKPPIGPNEPTEKDFEKPKIPLNPQAVELYKEIKEKILKINYKKLLIGVGIFFISAIVLMALISFIQKNIKLPKTFTQINVSSPTPTQTTSEKVGWKNFRNEELGIIVKIPNSWTSSIEEGTNAVLFEAKDKSQLEISSVQSNLSLIEYLDSIDTTSQTAWEGQPSKEILSSLEDKVAGYISERRKEKWLAAGFETIVTYLKADNRIFTFTALPNENGEIQNTEVGSNYEEVMASFQFLKWSDISTWKVWTDPDVFTIKYTPNAKISRINQNTMITFEYGNREITLTFTQYRENARNKTVLKSCEGKCDQQKEIEVKLGDETQTVTQIWPNSNKDYTFQIKKKYPGTTYDKYLSIFATYPSEERLTEINQTLSTFAFINTKK